MSRHIQPIHTTSVPSLKWAPAANKDALGNLQSLLNRLAKAIRKAAEGTLPPEEQKAAKETVKAALAESGQNIASALLLQSLAHSAIIQAKAAGLTKKKDPQVLREALALQQNLGKLRSKSHLFNEAWPEIEAIYCLKMSLYHLELEKRRNN